MFKPFYLLYRLIHFFFTISNYQILTRSGSLNPGWRIKAMGILLSIIFSPHRLIISKTGDFGERIRNCLTRLGIIYIKFGQVLSTRPDLVGDEVSSHLKSLQDKIPAFSSAKAKAIIEEEFSQKLDSLFVEFDRNPASAASVAQVHKARLKDGAQVAVKILRPGIEAKYSRDMDFLSFCAALASAFILKTKRLKLQEIVSVLKRSMRYETDLRLEAAGASELTENFKDDATVVIPKIYWHMNSPRVLVTQWIDGVSIYDKKLLKAKNIDGKDMARKVATMFFNQTYRDGFFHADLHPGNIMVDSKSRIVLIDFGLMGRIGRKDRFAIAEILYAFLRRDFYRVAKIHKKVGYIPPDADLELFTQVCRSVAEPVVGLPIKEISIGSLLIEIFKITEEFGMETQPQLLLLQKNMVLIEGIARTMDEDVNMWAMLDPWLKKWWGKNLSPEAKLIRMGKKLLQKLTSDLEDDLI